jgi:hypothetical protein
MQAAIPIDTHEEGIGTSEPHPPQERALRDPRRHQADPDQVFGTSNFF